MEEDPEFAEDVLTDVDKVRDAVLDKDPEVPRGTPALKR